MLLKLVFTEMRAGGACLYKTLFLFSLPALNEGTQDKQLCFVWSFFSHLSLFCLFGVISSFFFPLSVSSPLVFFFPAETIW